MLESSCTRFIGSMINCVCERAVKIFNEEDISLDKSLNSLIERSIYRARSMRLIIAEEKRCNKSLG